MTANIGVAQLPVMLNALRLPTIRRVWQELGARADRESWGSARFLAAMCDPTMTVAAIDRLVHHATILELNTESYRGARLSPTAPGLPQRHHPPPHRVPPASSAHLVNCLRRRSQKNRRMPWAWFERMMSCLSLPQSRITHPWTPRAT